MADLAKKYNFTRQYIYLLLRKYRIPRRNQREARISAIDKGYLFKTGSNNLGEKEKIFHQKRVANEDFFKKWSDSMAYVLGVFYSDGVLSPSKDREEREIHKNRALICSISLSQKEPELLEKVLALMESNAHLQFQPQRGKAGALYTFRIRSNKLYDDVLRHGLTPRKSLTMTFPKVPQRYLRHFIRGCWDGDGSIYLEGNNQLKPRADYVCGSRAFVEVLTQELTKQGLTKATVHTKKTGKSFYVKYGPQDCERFFHLFYDGVDKGMYLNRKYLRFKAAAEAFYGNENAWLFKSTNHNPSQGELRF